MARFDMAQRDYAGAAEKWHLVRRGSPDALEPYTSGSFCLEQVGDFNGAMEILEAGKQRHPGNAHLEERCREIRARLRASEMRDMLMSFESLGGRHEGCEFGNVQRHYGAEPLGLLRWADMGPDALISALERRFEGVGDPENTILSPPWDGGDWMLKDTRFGMSMHTFLHDEDTEENRDRIFRLMCRRLRFLARKILEDLAAAEKVFVYKLSYETLDRDRLLRLHQAVRMHGASTLLYVRQSNAEHPPGTVIVKAPGLMIGFIERFSFEFGPNPEYLGAAPECWTPVVTAAYRLWRAVVPHGEWPRDLTRTHD
jgi:hypothetical protein